VTQEGSCNAPPEGFEGKQKLRTEPGSADEAFDLHSRRDDNPEDLRRAIAIKLKNPELVEIDERLQSLVIDPINALPEAERTVNGTVRSGEEIARAIPDVTAFLAEVNLQTQDGVLLDFFELNESGQLVMKDNCLEAYGLDENALQARMSQTRIVYAEDGKTRVMTGEEYFNVTKRDREDCPLEMELSEVAKKIDLRSILMVRGLPTLKENDNKHTGEYARMNRGQLEKVTLTWTDDDLLNASCARVACWDGKEGILYSFVDTSYAWKVFLGSRGVLRVNLNFAK
jgi:hypothetical protein